MNEQIVNQVFSVYEILKDSIKVTRRSINKNVSTLHNRTLFLGEQKDEMLNKMTSVEAELDDMIDALQDVVKPEVRSKIKQIYTYRNWVAHGKNQNKLPSIQTDPKTVQATLCDFMIQAKISI